MIRLLIVCLLAVSPALALAAEAPQPDTVAKGYYAPYLPGGDLDKSFNGNLAIQNRTLSKGLRDLLRKAGERDGNDSLGGVLGFDPIVNGQDWELSRLETRLESIQPGKDAVVIVSFRNMGARNRLRYSFLWEQGDWRVDNIESLADPMWNLRTLLGG